MAAFATKCDEESGGDSDLDVAADAGVFIVVAVCDGLVPDPVGVGGRRDHRRGFDVADGGVT